MRKFVRDELILKPAQPSLSMHGFKKENYHKKKNKTKQKNNYNNKQTKQKETSHHSLVWFGYLLKGDFRGFLDCSGFKILFAAIVITSAKDARGGLGMGSTPFSQITCVLFSLRPCPLRAWNRAKLQRLTNTIKQAYLSWISQESLMANPIKPYRN